MGILGNLFGRKASDDAELESDVLAPLVDSVNKSKKVGKKVVPLDFGDQPDGDVSAKGDVAFTTENVVDDSQAIMDSVVEAVANEEATSEADSAVSIWDLDDDIPTAEALAAQAPAPAVEKAEPTAAPARRRRNKTRLIGFDKSDGQVVDLFNETPAPVQSTGVKFPVGWVVVVEGPGLGTCFTLLAGMSPIGRGEDQTVQLDFGDNSISRTNHAAIVYDQETHQFLLGHGGKSNLVRLNDSPLISNETLKDGDQIRLGETTLRFSALCDEEFNWGKSDAKEIDDVEIA